MNSFIPIYIPFTAKNQKKYLHDCIKTNQIGQGKYIQQYEAALQKYLDIKYVITTSNGSVSLQLILFALGIGHGDEVITASLTYAATVSSINILGAKAILVDSDDSFQLNIEQVEKAITNKTKAVMVPQLYGNSPDMNRLVDLCEKQKIFLIEDSAEAFGCSTNNKKLGTFGIASSFSTFANKTITTFEGGFIATNDDTLEKKIRLLKNQSHLGHFIHDGLGFNARLTNFQAAIGLAQLEDIDKIIYQKVKIAEYYRAHLSDAITKIIPSIKSTEWMPLFVLPDGIPYLKFYTEMRNMGIDTRPAFKPVHLMSGFNVDVRGKVDTAEAIYGRGFNLPCYPDLTNKQLNFICETTNKILKKIC